TLASWPSRCDLGKAREEQQGGQNLAMLAINTARRVCASVPFHQTILLIDRSMLHDTARAFRGAVARTQSARSELLRVRHVRLDRSGQPAAFDRNTILGKILGEA